MPMLRRCTGTPVTRPSSMNMSPAFGSTRPAIIRNVVVLPQPLGPSNATMQPGAIDKERRSTARVAP
jgi:hypothetical protein